MNPSHPGSNDPSRVAGVDETTTVDLADVELALESARRGGPPPLPPELPGPLSPASPRGAPPAQAAPGRSNAFYVVLVLVVVAIGGGAGAVVARWSRKGPPAAGAAPAAGRSKAAAPGVITIPTVEVLDSRDAGP